MKDSTFRLTITLAGLLLIAGVTVLLVIDRPIRLIVRGDDMRFSHAANEGCLRAHRDGILTAVEIMVPCDHFLEAVTILKECPDLDVGIHLTLTSEWVNIRWGPLTDAPSLVGDDGFFLPMVWPDEPNTDHLALGTSDWQFEEIERELRAQIELALEHLPNISHVTPHMGFQDISPSVRRLVINLMQEYDIAANLQPWPIPQISLFDDAYTVEEMVSNAVATLEELKPGTWQLYEHPGMLIEGLENHWHPGAEDDARYRDAVTRALTDVELQRVIKRRDIQLIGYRDL